MDDIARPTRPQARKKNQAANLDNFKFNSSRESPSSTGMSNHSRSRRGNSIAKEQLLKHERDDNNDLHKSQALTTRKSPRAALHQAAKEVAERSPNPKAPLLLNMEVQNGPEATVYGIHRALGGVKPMNIQEEEEADLPLGYYTPRQVYQLEFFNSLTISNGHIYNLLEVPISKDKPLKEIKCNCTNSRCMARYCLCFSKARKCTGECGCQNCSNQSNSKQRIEPEEFKGCRCEKSECQKLYCECRKEGLLCSPKCKCKGCKNVKEPELPRRTDHQGVATTVTR